MSIKRIRPIESYFKVNTQNNSKKAQKECKSNALICNSTLTPSPKYKNISEESRTIIDIEIHEKMKKKVVKVEEKKEISTQISKILFKGSLRTRFEKLQSIQTIQDMMEIQKYQQFYKIFFILNNIIKEQTMSYQEIKIQFKQDYQIEFKVQTLQQMMTIWPEIFDLTWKYLEYDKYILEIGLELKQSNIFGDKNKIFQEKLFNYIKQNGEFIELHSLPDIIEDKIEFKNQECESQTHCFDNVNFFKQKTSPLKQIALELQAYYSMRKVSNMFLQNVENYLLKLTYTKNEIRMFIDELVQKFPQWIMLVDSQSDKILRINRDLNIKQLIFEADCQECN